MTDPAATAAPPDGPLEPVLMPPRGLVATVLAILLATAAAAVLWAPPVPGGLRPSLRLNLWQQDADVGAMRARDDALLRFARDAAAEADIRQRLSAYLHDENREGAIGGADEPATRLALGELEERIRALAQAGGGDAVRALAVAWGRDVRQAAEQALAEAQAQGLPLQSFLRLSPRPKAAQTLVDVAGGLGRTLATAGFDRLWQADPERRDAGRLPPAAGMVVESLAQQRIFALGQRMQGGPPQLPSDAWLLLLRFRIEAHEGLTIDRKLQLLQDLAVADPGAPVAYLQAVLLARAARWTEARAWFLQAAQRGEMRRQAAVNARWCAQQAARPTDPEAP